MTRPSDTALLKITPWSAGFLESSAVDAATAAASVPAQAVELVRIVDHGEWRRKYLSTFGM